MTAPTEQDWSAAVGMLRDAPEVALVCHVAPDGDALGSMLALGTALRARHGGDRFVGRGAVRGAGGL